MKQKFAQLFDIKMYLKLNSTLSDFFKQAGPPIDSQLGFKLLWNFVGLLPKKKIRKNNSPKFETLFENNGVFTHLGNIWIIGSLVPREQWRSGLVNTVVFPGSFGLGRWRCGSHQKHHRSEVWSCRRRTKFDSSIIFIPVLGVHGFLWGCRIVTGEFDVATTFCKYILKNSYLIFWIITLTSINTLDF